MKKKIANWGNYPVIESEEKSFSFQDQLFQALKETNSFIPRGNGRCYGDASLASETISTLKFDKVLQFDTINGVPAAGGSFDGPGPVVVDGMVYFLSGNCCIVGRPGNALFAFELAAE